MARVCSSESWQAGEKPYCLLIKPPPTRKGELFLRDILRLPARGYDPAAHPMFQQPDGDFPGSRLPYRSRSGQFPIRYRYDEQLEDSTPYSQPRSPHQDSNLGTWFRKPLLYPLSYGGQAPHTAMLGRLQTIRKSRILAKVGFTLRRAWSRTKNPLRDHAEDLARRSAFERLSDDEAFDRIT